MNSFATERTVRFGSTGVMAALCAVTMFFAALASAYYVRRGISSDWTALQVPPVLFASVLPGIGVSFALRSAARLPAVVLGLVFAAMHAYAWQRIAGQGTPAAAFFCVMDAALLCLVAAGTIAAIRGNGTVLAAYWQYVNALWILLLVFLNIWK